MTTPKRKDIIERAFEIHQQRNHDVNSNNPELEEVKESGFYDQAKRELMYSKKTQYLSYLEKEANELGYSLTKTKIEYSNELPSYPIEAIMKEGSFVTGGRRCGKTNLIKILVMEAIRAKVQVKVFDPSLAWKSFPLPKSKVKRNLSVGSEWNRIYDVSRLSVTEARDFVRDMLKNDLTEAIHLTDQGFKNRCLVVIEESQNVVPSHSLRSKRFLDISRFITQGRNFGMSYIASTQRLASVDINLIEVSGVRYWFKLEGHRNLVKARYWLPKFTVFRLRDLNVGECYLQIGSEIKLLRLPLFEEARKVIA